MELAAGVMGLQAIGQIQIILKQEDRQHIQVNQLQFNVQEQRRLETDVEGELQIRMVGVISISWF